jgi:hypothetical protein
MNWHYAENGQSAGPVTDEQLAQLFQSGRINRSTLVWREGLPDWVPYGQAVAPAGTGSPRPGEGICAECGQYFPADDLVSLNKTLVCAGCKPLFLQRMAEGAPTTGAAGLWREGKRLVTRSETPFPDRCVKCNAPAGGFQLKRVLYWQHPAYYLLILCNLLVLLIVLLIVRKKAVLHVGLCDAHRTQRKTAIIACLAGMLGGVAMMIAAGFYSLGWLALAGGTAFIGGIIWGVVKGRVVYATRIEKDEVWVGGVCQEFLNELPER